MDEDRRYGTSVHTAAKYTEQHCDSRNKIETVGKRDEQRDTHRRG
jgi:hypothetical protein